MLNRTQIPVWFVPERTNFWSFQRCEPRWVNHDGAPSWFDRFGLFPGQIVANLLYYFAEPDDLVVDPFAGSGTTGLVCADFRVRYRMFDLTPRAPDIKQCDSSAKLPLRDGEAGLLFLDPPYWQMHRYSEDRRDLSTMELKEFVAASTRAVREATRVLRVGGHLAILMNSVWRNVSAHFDHPLDLSMLFYWIASSEGLVLVERISIANQNFENPAGRHARRGRTRVAMLRGFRDLMVFRKKAVPAQVAEPQAKEPRTAETSSDDRAPKKDSPVVPAGRSKSTKGSSSQGRRLSTGKPKRKARP